VGQLVLLDDQCLVQRAQLGLQLLDLLFVPALLLLALFLGCLAVMLERFTRAGACPRAIDGESRSRPSVP
jgi:hypothetical protein